MMVGTTSGRLIDIKTLPKGWMIAFDRSLEVGKLINHNDIVMVEKYFPDVDEAVKHFSTVLKLIGKL